MRIAPLEWYEANESLPDISVGSQPSSLSFDGVNMWVANYGNSRLRKLRASDGEHVGTFLVGSGPTAIAFDGVRIWVANGDSSSVSRL
jgi:DNA-binding beta-propeller fold protein YncE